MTSTKYFIEDQLLKAIENKKNMEMNYLDHMPLEDSQIAEWHYLDGYISALKFVLAGRLNTNFHEYTSEILIKDVLSRIIPHIGSHSDKCSCHACITNDVLQYFIRNDPNEKWVQDEGVIKKW